MTAKLSVVIPHLNYGRFLAQCLDSITTQTLQPDEIILVDGGSTDNTFEILENYPIVKVIREPFKSGHIPHAINLGLLEATGSFINVSNSDCWLERKYFEETVPVLENNEKVALVYTNWRYVNKEGKTICDRRSPPTFDREKLLRGNYIDLMCGLFRRDAGFFDESLAYHYDWIKWIRISRNCKVKFVNKVLVNFRIHDQQRARDPEYLTDLKLAQIKIRREENPSSHARKRLPIRRRLRRAASIVLGRSR